MGLIQKYRERRGQTVLRHQGFDEHGNPTSCRVRAQTGSASFDLCKKFSDECIAVMVQSMHDIGEGRDRVWRTRSDQYAQAVRQFARAATHKDLLYWSHKATPWCPACGTTLAHIETGLIEVEKTQYFIDLQVDGRVYTVMTTRPDLAPFTTVLLHHPTDQRYLGLPKEVHFLGRSVPVMVDPTVDPQRGTGLMLVAPYGDYFDIERLERLGFGTPQAAVPLDQTAVKTLVDQGLVRAGRVRQAPCVAHTERSNCRTPVEFRTVPNLFMKIEPLRQELRHKFTRLEFTPVRPEQLRNWIDHMHDWCISRQYTYGRSLRQVGLQGPEGYVLDCWFQSAVSFLFLTKNFHRPAMRFQGRQIGRTWLIYTLIAACVLDVPLPFDRCVLTNLILGASGKKFSKADSSGLPPLPGGAALALWSAGTFLPQDQRFDPRDFKRAEFLVRKLPHVCRFFREVVPDGPDPMAQGLKCVAQYHMGMMKGDVHKLYDLVDYLVQHPAGCDARRLRTTGALPGSKHLFIEALEQIADLLHA